MKTSQTFAIRLLISLLLMFAVFPNVLRAQFQTPIVDGVIEADEYGNTENGTNQLGTNTGQTWYMTWDATNLYVGIVNANLSEGAIIYINAHPTFPVGSGTDAEGNLSGFNYDGTDFSTLPFRAQFVTYFKDGYREYRSSDGAGNWTTASTSFGSYASNSTPTNTREIAIPWAAITSGLGRPASFLFFGYLTSSGGYVFGQVPNDNPGAFIGTAAVYAKYFEVISTTNGSSTPPFSLEPPYPAVGNIIGKTGPQNARNWTLQVTNQGTASVTPVIDSFTLTQTGGAACTPVVAGVPETTQEISAGGSAQGIVTIDFTGCSMNARFTAKFNFHTLYGTGSVTRNNQFE
jgi:hypothetical protein